MARKKYNYNFVRKPSEGGKEALYMAGASVFLFLLASVVSFAFRGNGGIFLGAAGLFSFLLSGYGFYVGMPHVLFLIMISFYNISGKRSFDIGTLKDSGSTYKRKGEKDGSRTF